MARKTIRSYQDSMSCHGDVVIETTLCKMSCLQSCSRPKSCTATRIRVWYETSTSTTFRQITMLTVYKDKDKIFLCYFVVKSNHFDHFDNARVRLLMYLAEPAVSTNQ